VARGACIRALWAAWCLAASVPFRPAGNRCELGAAHGSPESLAMHWTRFRASAVYVVSPSYFGAESDLQALADVAHSRASP